jgi:hypothetical protein
MGRVGRFLLENHVRVYACAVMTTPWNEIPFHLTEPLSDGMQATVVLLGADICDFRRDPKAALDYWSKRIDTWPEDRRVSLLARIEEIRKLAEREGLT